MVRAIHERDRLVRECHDLLWQVARRPGCIKLLMGVRHQLQIFAGYKKGRWERWS
jgi:hypothetical protein